MSIIQNDQLYQNEVEIKINRLAGVAGGDILPTPFSVASPHDDASSGVPLAPNEIDNSDFAYSKDDYLNATPAGNDAAKECYNWYRQMFFRLNDVSVAAAGVTVNSPSNPFKAAYTYPMPFVLLSGKSDGKALSGTLTRVSDSSATLSVAPAQAITNGLLWFGEQLAESSALALKSTNHSTFAANEGAKPEIPEWDTAGGWASIGSNVAVQYDLACPLPFNAARAGLRFYFSVILALRSGAAVNTNPLRLSAGIWDGTADQNRFIEAANMTLNVATVGAAGTTTYNYKIIAIMESGLRIESNITLITTGNANLSTSNYNRLQWTNTRGILDFIIERETGGVFTRVFTISNGATAYNDYGQYSEVALTAFTNIGAGRAIAYAETTFLLPPQAGAWRTVSGVIDIPPTYDSGATTGIQWLRVGVSGAMTDVRQVLLDRVLLSLSDGGWNISSRDRTLTASRVPSVNPAGSSQGSAGINNNCITGVVMVWAAKKEGELYQPIPANQLEKGIYVDGGGMKAFRITRIREAEVDEHFVVILSNNVRIECTSTERFITSRADKNGTRLDELLEGDEILCKIEGRCEKASIKEIIRVKERLMVYTLSLRGGHTFVAGSGAGKGGAILHNRKADDEYLLRESGY